MIKIRLSLLCFLVGSFLFFLIKIPSADCQEFLSLQQATARALEANPDLAAMHAKALALADIPAQQGSLPDPRLTLNLANLPVDTFSNTQEPMTQMQIGLSQALPYPGKLALRQQIATFEGEAAAYDVEEQRLMLIRDVKTVWWNLYYLDRAMETVERNQELLRQLEAVAQQKYRVGNGLQQDVLLAQLELSKLLETRLGLEKMRHNEGDRLKTLLDFPMDQAIKLRADSPVSLPKPVAFDDLIDLANANRPLLSSLGKRLEAARLKVDLAEKDYLPDFALGAAYGYRNGLNANGSERADFASLSFSMNLPFFAASRYDHAFSQRSKEKLAQQLALRNSRKKVEAEISTAISDFRIAVDEVTLFNQGIIPQAKQTVGSMLAGYQVNKVDFLNLIRAQTSVYNYETRYWKAFSTANQAFARLEAAVGKELPYE
jgi:outer membrane protein TolC